MKRSKREVLEEMQILAKKFSEVKDEINGLLEVGEKIENVIENEDRLSRIMGEVSALMQEVNEIEHKYKKCSEEIKSK